MKITRTRRRRAAPAPPAPSLQIDLQAVWRRYTCLLQKGCEVLSVVTVPGVDHGALVRLTTTGALVRVTGGEVTMLSQSRERMRLLLLKQHQRSPVMKMVEVEDRPQKNADNLPACRNSPARACCFELSATRGR
jgi:hypothetical protein